MTKTVLWVKISENASEKIHYVLDEYFDCVCDSGEWHSYTNGCIYVDIYDDCFVNDLMEFIRQEGFTNYVRLGLKNRDY